MLDVKAIENAEFYFHLLAAKRLMAKYCRPMTLI